jgi:hypothetical protein
MADDPTTDPAPSPDADELAQLRREKAEREAADRKAKDDELAELRDFKAKQDAKRTVTAPTPRAEKTPAADPPPAAKPDTTAEKPRPRSGVSSRWFGPQ